MNNIEVLCLEGLEDACIGYQVVLKGNAPVLVYDYAKTIEVLRASGYADDEIQEFVEEVTQVDYINPPIFVNFNDEMANSKPSHVFHIGLASATHIRIVFIDNFWVNNIS